MSTWLSHKKITHNHWTIYLIFSKHFFSRSLSPILATGPFLSFSFFFCVFSGSMQTNTHDNNKSFQKSISSASLRHSWKRTRKTNCRRRHQTARRWADEETGFFNFFHWVVRFEMVQLMLLKSVGLGCFSLDFLKVKISAFEIFNHVTRRGKNDSHDILRFIRY